MHRAKVAAIQTNHGGEFENKSFNEFYDEQGIKHQYSSPRTPEQMELWKERIGFLLRWQEQYWQKVIYPRNFGQKQSIQRATF